MDSSLPPPGAPLLPVGMPFRQDRYKSRPTSNRNTNHCIHTLRFGISDLYNLLTRLSRSTNWKASVVMDCKCYFALLSLHNKNRTDLRNSSLRIHREIANTLDPRIPVLDSLRGKNFPLGVGRNLHRPKECIRRCRNHYNIPVSAHRQCSRTHHRSSRCRYSCRILVAKGDLIRSSCWTVQANHSYMHPLCTKWPPRHTARPILRCSNTRKIHTQNFHKSDQNTPVWGRFRNMCSLLRFSFGPFRVLAARIFESEDTPETGRRQPNDGIDESTTKNSSWS
mmetsp:Transcript_17412/g.40038  ORF Transcript_17412/g.40038 Transcript_17412/m.40038 type:complete len:280 (-) Transcript_17412:123-962(-)